jgi:YfiH family protein
MKMEMFIEPPNITSSAMAFFTTRALNFKNDDIKSAISSELSIPDGSIYLPLQKHTDKVHVLENDTGTVIADAVVTGMNNVLIGVLVADCVPVLLYDRKQRVIGVVHAGWRGTAKQILKNTIQTMTDRFESAAEDILVAIGPSIRQCSYQVSEDVKEEVERATGKGQYFCRQNDRYFIDLSAANKIQALNTGIAPGNLWLSEECTYCKPERFYSYRYSNGPTGRQGGFIGMW